MFFWSSDQTCKRNKVFLKEIVIPQIKGASTRKNTETPNTEKTFFLHLFHNKYSQAEAAKVWQL